MELDRPVIVTGTPRSGKSCISEILDHLDEFKWLSEPLMVWDMEFGARPDDRRGAEDATDALRTKITNACADLVGGSPGVRYLDDLSYHALRTPFVHALMPNAKIIHVIRKPQDAVPEMSYGWSYKDTVAKAILRRRNAIRPSTLPRHLVRFARNFIVRRLKGRRATWGPRVPDLAEFVGGHSVAEVAGYQWMKMVEIAKDDLETLPQENWLEVRFDRLLADPGGEALRIGQFCGVKSPQALADFAVEYIDPTLVYDRRVEPSAEEWVKVNKMIESLQQRLGYAE